MLAGMQHLLVAVDGSECAQRAAHVAVDLAARLSARVTLACVLPPPPELGEPAMVDLGRLESAHVVAARALLDRTLAAVQRAGVAIDSVLLHGPAPEALNEAAEKLHADLLVVGSRGRNALARAILGSVSHALIQTSKKPVLVVH